MLLKHPCTFMHKIKFADSSSSMQVYIMDIDVSFEWKMAQSIQQVLCHVNCHTCTPCINVPSQYPVVITHTQSIPWQYLVVIAHTLSKYTWHCKGIRVHPRSWAAARKGLGDHEEVAYSQKAPIMIIYCMLDGPAWVYIYKVSKSQKMVEQNACCSSTGKKIQSYRVL